MKIIDDITKFIFMNDTLSEADIIFLPGVADVQTVKKATSLWKLGLATYILPSGKHSKKLDKFPIEKLGEEYKDSTFNSEWEFFYSYLVSHDIPEKNILKEDKATNTYENAFESKKIVDSLNINVKKAIICCQSFHARRVFMTYQLAFPDTELMVCAVDTKGITKNNWYTNDFAIGKVMGELRKCSEYFQDKIKGLQTEYENTLIYNSLLNRTSKRIRIYNHLDSLLENKYPVTLEVHPTNLCNANCDFCFFREKNSGKESLSETGFAKLIDDIINLGIKGVVFSGGGEPTLYSSLPYGIEKLGKNKIDVGLITNGINLTDEIVNVIPLCKWIRISVCAPTKEKYVNLTNNSLVTFDKVLKNISKIVVNNPKKTVIGISILIQPNDDIDYYMSSIKLASNLGVNQVFFKPLICESFKNIKFDVIVNHVEELLSYASQKKVVTNLRKLYDFSNKTNKKLKGEGCKMIENNLVGVVVANGYIYPCLDSFINCSELNLGNIYTDTLNDAFSTERLKTFNDNIRDEICAGCKYGNLVSEIEFCKKNKTIKVCDDLHNNFL